jgi:hypothetical protein
MIGAALFSGAVIATVPENDRTLLTTVSAQDVIPNPFDDDQDDPVDGDRLRRRSQVTYIGCVMRERDYRAQQGTRTGGWSNTGWGLGDEYMLINAAPADQAGPANDCGANGSGEVIELKGPRESDLVGLVGTRVSVNGRWSGARLDSPDSYETRGGSDNFGGELHLREIKVHFFQPMPVPPPTPVAAVIVPPAPAPAPAPEPQAEATTGQEPEVAVVEVERLPQTASPLPFTGLLGLLSLFGAFGVRTLRRQ